MNSACLITGDDGAEDKRTAYQPFGQTRDWVSDATAAEETKGFIGERYDTDAGLQYLNARYYDPELGIFIQPDWFEVTEPGVGTNRYSYSFNDPVNLMDPMGNAVPLGLGYAAAACSGGGCQAIVATAVRTAVSNVAKSQGANAAKAAVAVATATLIDSIKDPAINDMTNPYDEFSGIEGLEGASTNPEPGSSAAGMPTNPEPTGAIVSTPVGSGLKLPTAVEARKPPMKPIEGAFGPHTTIKHGPNGEVIGYQEWTENPQNPSGFDAGKRVDVKGKPHTNVKTGKPVSVPTPHVHEPGEKDVRPAEPDEIPK